MERETQATIDGKIETQNHINSVSNKISKLMMGLSTRKDAHDATKLESPEKEIFGEYSPKLKTVDYGSKEYFELLASIKPALDHHYANNSHHPEYYENGIAGMDLLDLNEMFCDWLAATERMKNGGDIHKSIDFNAKRFNIDPQIVQIFHNTATRIFNKWTIEL